VPGYAYLYLIARERADGGPPYLLKKIPVPAFPYAFTMDQSDVGQMFGAGIVLAEIPEMYLIARIDQDGMAMPQPGDLEGECLQNPIAGGAQNLEIVIDRAY
jgi:cytochrome c-type biogenesis protein CcmH